MTSDSKLKKHIVKFNFRRGTKSRCLVTSEKVYEFWSNEFDDSIGRAQKKLFKDEPSATEIKTSLVIEE